MTISRIQLATIAPYAATFTLDALVGDGDGAGSYLAQTLDAHGLTEPGVAVQFLAACHLASHGFVNFVAPQPLGGGRALFQSPEAWINARARDWHEWNLTDSAREWDFNYIVDRFGERFTFTTDYPTIWQTLQTVCDVLGIGNGMEQFTLEG